MVLPTGFGSDNFFPKKDNKPSRVKECQYII